MPSESNLQAFRLPRIVADRSKAVILIYCFLPIRRAPLLETILTSGARVSAISLMSSNSTTSEHVYSGRAKIIIVPLGHLRVRAMLGRPSESSLHTTRAPGCWLGHLRGFGWRVSALVHPEALCARRTKLIAENRRPEALAAARVERAAAMPQQANNNKP